tara:strand:- start:7793 stop:8077 length:285 start_codon:yes stop_codon:yes gene_type:complete
MGFNEIFYQSRTWSTKAWVDGRRDPQVESWSNVDEAVVMAEAGMKHANSDSIQRLEVIGTRFVDGKREEVIQHAWNQTSSGRFITRVSDGTEMI